jgi:hypothetical protein
MANPIQIQKFLKGVDYPITKPEVIQRAQENGADKMAITVLTRIAGQKFDSPVELSQAIGNVHLDK